MDDKRLIDDVAHATSRHVVEIFGHLLRPEERADFFWEVFASVQAGLEAYRAFKAEEVGRYFRTPPGAN